MKLKKILILPISVIGLAMLIYASAPEPFFPPPPAGSVQSMEEADTENSLRKAYFTDFDREQVIRHYKQDFKLRIFGIEIPAMRLNYPPEDAQVLIRDQTRSSFLEELTYPLRQSLFINGFKPKEAKDEIWYKGVHYEQKITVRFVPSSRPVRIVVSLGIVLCLFVVIRFILISIQDFFAVLMKLRTK
jgi:hypothetical protein